MGDLWGPVRRFTAAQLEHPLEDFTVHRSDRGIFLREATRVGASVAFVLSRTRQERRTGDTAGPPGRPFDGYGSRERYVSARASEYGAGSSAEGTRAWWFIPDTLRDGESAPVVVYLHGFRASAPDLYWEHIHHLTAQGYIVIFPRINKGGMTGMFTDNDQNGMVERAVLATETALDELGPLADRDQLYLFGHSLGGLIGACWNGFGGPPAKGLVLAHPSVSTDAIPEAARRFITTIDWRPLVAENRAPVIVLGGDQDTLVPPEECLELVAKCTRAESSIVYIAKADGYGVPAVRTGHLAMVRSDAKAIRWLGQTLGGNEAADAIHSRFYHAALDAMLDGNHQPELDFGKWSDGTPLTPPSIEHRSTPARRRKSARTSKNKTSKDRTSKNKTAKKPTASKNTSKT
jgi:pimeloyl-ACP methyl ester carboxylesterase